ncbi:MAG: glycerol acyltransferase [Bacteroidetes bacterium]|nr:MAG: glycerol acyltransferase [Bacteroidota bacterium]
MEKIFTSIYDYFEKNRKVFFIIFILSFALAGWFASRVHFEEDISKVLPKDKKIEKLNQVFQSSKFVDKLVVMVSLKDTSAADPDLLVSYADSLIQSVRNRFSPYISKIQDKVDDQLAYNFYRTITDHLPVFLNDHDYMVMDSLLNPATISKTLEYDYRTLSSPAGLALKRMISSDPAGISFLGLKKLQQLQYDENFELFDNYIVTRDHKNLLFFITPAYPPNNTGQNAELLRGIDQVRNELNSSNGQKVESLYFGATAVSVGNALQLRRDSIFTQGMTLVFLIVFITLYFRRKRAAVLILIPVIFGALFSLSAIYFIKGNISVIAMGAGSVVLGVAVNYSLHLFNHYRHTRNIREVIRDLSMPLTVGSFTTIGGFLCLEFVQSEMLKDLGLFAAFSLIGAALSTLIFLPHLIATPREIQQHRIVHDSWIDKISSLRPEYNKWIIAAIVLLTLVFAYTARWVRFEPDLNRMNYISPDLKKAEDRLKAFHVFGLESVYLVSDGQNLDNALVNNEKTIAKIDSLNKQGVINKYVAASSLVVSDSLQNLRLQRWNSYWTAEKKNLLLANLANQGRQFRFKAEGFKPFENWLNQVFKPLDRATKDSIRKNFLDDFFTEANGNATVVSLLKVDPSNKQTVYKAFENDPHVTVLDKQYLTSQFVNIINSDFNSIAWMTSILVFVVLWLTYGRIELTLVSFIPMFITFIWILGIMGIFDIRFNIINIIISAFIFGLGDDYSLFIMDGLLREYKTGKKNLASYKSSILLSAITTVAGLGVLIFAKHPALRSIAIISIVGIVCVVIMSQILIPFLFSFLIKNRIKRNLFPWTLLGLLKSIFSFSYFVLGSLILTVLGFILVRLNPFNKEKGKYVYHVILSAFCWSLIYIMGNVKKRIVNTGNEDFSQPSLIICNHQSFLDILITVMLHPKLILFTNHWVWNSPVFGAVVRMADYYPIMQGLENNLEPLEERIRNGYSVVVFPEGTRSVDGTMRRFHKGAFYLAEKLELDILPIIIHGSGYTMTKGDFLLKDGQISITILPRIKAGDNNFGTNYSERAKAIGKYFRSRYAEVRSNLEQPAFFKEKLINNYIYKGPVLEWYLKIKLRLEKNYQLFNDILPSEGRILDLGCGYGFLTYMLHFCSERRILEGVDYDEEKIETASHCFSKNDHIQFTCEDALNYKFQMYDGIILSDVLHYLQPEGQKKMIEKCISHLNPGGVIAIREGNKDLNGKHKGTVLTEFFSTKFFKFNKTSGNGLSYLSGEFIRQIAEGSNMEFSVIDKAKYTSNMIFLIKHENYPVHEYI